MYTLNLETISRESTNVGGKAKHLGDMIKAGLPVPPGFVVTTEAYLSFLKFNKFEDKIKNILENIDVNNPEELKEKTKEIESLFFDSQIPDGVVKEIKDAYNKMSVGNEALELGGKALDMIKAGRDQVFVAVRSSATAEDLADASFAGQMKTFVNITGLENLLEAVKRCWTSLYTARAIFYRKTQGVEATPLIGVIVQKMVNSDSSGVIFTCDPTTNNRDKIIIEASWGLGQAVVSGLVTPDIYVLDKESGKLLEKKISKKLIMFRKDQIGKTIKQRVDPDKVEAQVLNENEIKKLWELAKKTEESYGGQPQDIEWCEERNRIFLVQTRPVTTLAKEIETKGVEEKGEAVVIGIGASPGVVKGKVKVVNTPEELSKIEQGDIMVAKITNPDMVPFMKKAAAIITDEGGLTSHAAIVSRELGTPCIVGTGNGTEVLKDGDEVTVDAVNGRVYPAGVEAPVASKEVPGIAVSETGKLITATEIKANIAFPDTAEKVVGKVDGVGLLRAEHILTEQGKHPIYLAKNNPEELIQAIVNGVGKIAKVFYPKPVWYRSLDARTDEFASLEGGEEEPKEANPMLGWHGIRRGLDQPEIFKCELEALKRLHQEGLNNISLMLPFVSNVDELRKAKDMIDFPIKLGVMCETPACAVNLKEFCEEGLDFVSIGSNDLTQLTLGVDRGNTQIAKLYSEMNPAVLKLIKNVVITCKKYGVKSSICGEGPSNLPQLVEKLVEYGIDSISVEMDAIEKVKNTVARTERKLLLEKMRE